MLPVILVSLIFNLIEAFVIKPLLGELPAVAFHNYFVFALSEELCKLFMLKLLIDKNPDHAFSWLDLMAYMTIVGIGFEVIESVTYGVMMGAGPMLIRGITIMHAAFGFIMGYLLGKGKATGNNTYLVLAVIVPWFFHGTYDFCISPELSAINDNIGFISLVLAIASVVVIVRGILFLRKARSQERYTRPL